MKASAKEIAVSAVAEIAILCKFFYMYKYWCFWYKKSLNWNEWFQKKKNFGCKGKILQKFQFSSILYSGPSPSRLIMNGCISMRICYTFKEFPSVDRFDLCKPLIQSGFRPVRRFSFMRRGRWENFQYGRKSFQHGAGYSDIARAVQGDQEIFLEE